MTQNVQYKILFILLALCICVGCNRPSKANQYRAEKHDRDSIGLLEQERTLAYYQSQLEPLQQQADSLIRLFKYEKNDKYQDRGFFVRTAKGSTLRVMVRDDGQEPIAYRNGKRVDLNSERLTQSERDAWEMAIHLSIVIRDLQELEKRIQHTSLEVQKYQKRLQKN